MSREKIIDVIDKALYGAPRATAPREIITALEAAGYAIVPQEFVDVDRLIAAEIDRIGGAMIQSAKGE
jgi:hypothetical protein